MKKLINLECKKCHANLSEDENKGIFFCKYCGAKVILDNENEYIHRHIDDADIKRAETENLIKLKKLELAEKKYEDNKKTIKIMVNITLICIIIMIISSAIASNSGDSDHWGYTLDLLMFDIIMFMWIGKFLFFDDKK